MKFEKYDIKSMIFGAKKFIDFVEMKKDATEKYLTIEDLKNFLSEDDDFYYQELKKYIDQNINFDLEFKSEINVDEFFNDYFKSNKETNIYIVFLLALIKVSQMEKEEHDITRFTICNEK